MLSRRAFGVCAICAATGFAASEVEAQAQGTQTGGLKRIIIQKTELPGDKYVTILAVAEIPPGTNVARHTHPGVESSYVLEGEGELLVQGQPARKVKASDGFQIPPEIPHSARTGDKSMKLAVTYVVEKDKPLSSPAPE
jgi:quercetin dioxygenase-like cupin family protein